MRAPREVGVRAAGERARVSFAACQASGRPFGVLAAAIDDRALLARVLGDAWIAEVEAELLERLCGLLAGIANDLTIGEGRVFVHLPDADVARLSSLGEQILRGCAGWTCAAAGRERGVTIGLGLASSSAVEPRFDPRLVLEVLEGVAAEGLDVAADAGGNRAAHSELYSFLQRGLERREPALLDAQARRVAAARASAGRAGSESRAASTAPGFTAPRHGAESAPSVRPASPEPRPATPATPTTATTATTPATRPAELTGDSGDALRASFGDRLGAAVRELLRGASGGRADPLVERSLGALIEARLEEERRQARAAADQRYGRQVDVLERRLAKLNSAFHETELELQRAAFARTVDPGSPSAYRTVQGLTPGDSQFELKRQLMSEIFSENLELARRRAQ